MLNKAKILEIARLNGKIRTDDFSGKFDVSRQYVNSLISQLVQSKELIKIGSTRNSFYVWPEFLRSHPEILPNLFKKKYKNLEIEEHKVLMEIEEKFPQINQLSEQIKDIFIFAFSEMMNNAIEHSGSSLITVEVLIKDNNLEFIIGDSGVGVFRNIMNKKSLGSELEAIQDLLKGKTTTMPKSHTGQGIFFTSKVADIFVLESFHDELLIDNEKDLVTARKMIKVKRGTRVIFKININSGKHLSEVFKKFTNLTDESDYGFDKTEIRINLYTASGVNISRSQARRVLHGLEKFKIIMFDFDKVPMVGQAFADEIYRVFHNKYPEIELQETNMSDSVKFMVDRARTEAKV